MTTYSSFYELEEQFREKIDFKKNIPKYNDDNFLEEFSNMEDLLTKTVCKKKIELPRLDKKVLKEASYYAYKFLKPRKFLTKINNDYGTEIRIFDKWEEASHSFKWKLPDNREVNVGVSPSNVYCFDKNKNTFSVKENGHISFYCLLFKHNLNSAVKIRNLISGLIELYVNKVQGKFDTKDRKLIHVEAKKVLFNRFNLSIPAMTRILGGCVWNHLSREAASLAIKICGDKASSVEYNIILNNLEEVKDTLQKAPGVLPIWISYVKNLINGNDDKKSFDSFVMNPPIRSCDFLYPDIIKNTKKYLQSNFHPISNGEWKLLINTKISCVRKMMIHTKNLESFNRFLKFFIKTGMPRFSLIRPIIDMIGHLGERRFDNNDFGLNDFGFGINDPSIGTLESVVRACVAHTDKMKSGIKSFWSREGSLVNDWIRNENVNLDKNQMKAQWSWFVKKQSEWHDRIQQIEKNKLKNTLWNSAISEYEQDDYTIIPLTTSLMLFDEGKEMRHCVATYANKCLLDKCRIFSIQKDGQKIATVEVAKIDGKWKTVQVRGVLNSEVSSGVMEIANQIGVKYNEDAKNV